MGRAERGERMDREQAKDYIKSQLESYLTGKGINTRKPFICLNPEHGDSNPSMSYDKKRNKAHCFSCGADYDTLDIIAIEYGTTSPVDTFNKAHDLFRLNIDSNRTTAQQDFKEVQKQDKSVQKAHNTQDTQQEQKKDLSEYIVACAQRVSEIDYFKKRGLSEDIINRFNLGYDPDFSTKDKETFVKWKVAVIPTSKNSCTMRNINSKDKSDRIRKRGGSPVYNTKALWSGKPVFIVEGEIDALSVIEAGAEAVALGSTANAEQLIKVLKDKAPSNTLILSLDNDEDGEQTAEKIQKNFEALNIPFIKANIAGQHKDANEALIVNRELFIQEVQEAQDAIKAQEEADKEAQREQYLKNSTVNHLQEFINGIAGSVDTPYIPTGFNKLDKVLDGGLYEGLYIVGAISSLGKTTFILQIADQIAQSGQDILIFSLEMARAELMAKSISRLTFELSKDPHNAKTTRGITTGKRYPHYSQVERDLIKNSIAGYGEYAQNIYITEGMGEIGAIHIRETVNKHILLTGKKPVIIIDYLQLLAPYDPRSTDKQNTDKAVMELKRISRDNKLPVIAISSFNRQNYKEAVTMEAFKESGAIEYSSDILIGIQAKGAGQKDFDVNEAKKKDPREIEVKILKNRNGATGDTIAYDYYPLFNYFKEV